MQYLQEFNEANVRHPKLARTQVVEWVPPSTTRYKVNVDGAVFMQQKTIGVEILIRDLHGQVVATMSKKFNAPLGPLEAEAKAWEEGVKFAMDVGVYDLRNYKVLMMDK